MEGADEEAAARAFVDFMLSQTAQRYFAEVNLEIPLVEGVEPPEGAPTAADLIVPDLDVRQLEDLEGTREPQRGPDHRLTPPRSGLTTLASKSGTCSIRTGRFRRRAEQRPDSVIEKGRINRPQDLGRALGRLLFGGDACDESVTAVDEKRLRKATHAQPGPKLEICVSDDRVGKSKFFDESLGVLHRVLDVYSYQHQTIASVLVPCRFQGWCFLAAGYAPRSPEVEDDHPSLELPAGQPPAAQQRQLEVGRRLALELLVRRGTEQGESEEDNECSRYQGKRQEAEHFGLRGSLVRLDRGFYAFLHDSPPSRLTWILTRSPS